MDRESIKDMLNGYFERCDIKQQAVLANHRDFGQILMIIPYPWACESSRGFDGYIEDIKPDES